MMRTLLLTLSVVLTGSLVMASEPVQVRGDYVEARTADVFTGPCFSNSEVFIVGDRAVMAWKVTEGTWDGVDLAGLGVAAALRASTTLSQDQPEEARAVLIVDEQANAEQREALIDMAQTLAGDRLDQVVSVRTAPIELNIAAADSAASHGPAHKHHLMPQAPAATFQAAELAQIATRPLNANDCICGNEVVAYPPLSQGVKAKPAYTVGHSFKGHGLNSTWNDPNARSAFVGQFAL